jgi:hypothetical protein
MRAWERVVPTICSGNERGRQLGRPLLDQSGEGSTSEACGLGSGLGGLPMLRSCEMAVTSWAGANGFSRRMLLGTPCDAH